MEMEDFVKKNEIVKKALKRLGEEAGYHVYRVILRKGNNTFVLSECRWLPGSANRTFPEIEIRAVTGALAKEEALVMLKEGGWLRVDDEKSVLEVERVYDTRYDCSIAPEGVRQAS